jgi:hypothetical protein
MQNTLDPNKPTPPQPSNIVDFSLPSPECCFEIENLPGPDEFEELHGYSIDDES